jgi:hypothetical protein
MVLNNITNSQSTPVTIRGTNTSSTPVNPSTSRSSNATGSSNASTSASTSSEGSNNIQKTSTKRSFVWTYMKIHSTLPNKAICKVCNQVVTYYGSSTTELINHLRAEHQINQSNYLNFTPQLPNSMKRKHDLISSSESETDEEEELCSAKQYSGPKKQKLDKLLMTMIMEENLPFSFSESESFRAYSYALNKHYKPLCRQTLTNTTLPNMVNNFLTI